MRHLWLLLHLAGQSLWVGGAIAAFIMGVTGRRESRAALATVARLQAAVQQLVNGPGAMITALSGIALTFDLQGSLSAPSPWLMLMQIAGLLAAALVFFVAWPTARQLSRVDPVGSTAVLFDALRRRQAIVSSIAGVLAVLSLVAGAMGRP